MHWNPYKKSDFPEKKSDPLDVTKVVGPPLDVTKKIATAKGLWLFFNM